MYPIVAFNPAENRTSGFIPWIDAGNKDLDRNAFFRRAFYYTRVDEHGMFAGEAELRAFDGEIEGLPVDKFMIVVSGTVSITDATGRNTVLKAGDTAALPRGLRARWVQPEGTRIYFMLYGGPSSPAASADALGVITPKLDDELAPISGPSPDLITSSPPPTVGRKIIYQDATGQFSVGMWEATAYTRKLAAFKDYEIMHFVQGEMEMSNAISESRLFKAGETFIVNRGVANAWKSEAYVRKVYAKLTPSV